jgi:hypothetical protein
MNQSGVPDFARRTTGRDTFSFRASAPSEP